MEDFINDLIERIAQNVLTGATTCRDVQERLQMAMDAMTVAVSSYEYEVKKYNSNNLDSVLFSFDSLLKSLSNKCEWPADFDWWSPSVFSYHLIWNTKDEILWYQNQFRPPKLGEYVFGWLRITSWPEVMSWKDQPVDTKAFKDFTDAVGGTGRASILDMRTLRQLQRKP